MLGNASKLAHNVEKNILFVYAVSLSAPFIDLTLYEELNWGSDYRCILDALVLFTDGRKHLLCSLCS